MKSKDNSPKLSLDQLASRLQLGEIKKIVVCSGAGISTSAGIPDFRSPSTGLYHNLQKFDLDYPEQVFDIEYFKKTPQPFYSLSEELLPGKFLPTKTHAFIRVLADKNLLLRCYTQNIDTLERRAGIPHDKIVEAHGSFANNHCIESNCKAEALQSNVVEAIMHKKIPRCQKCNGFVKPDIVFFGEALPPRFFKTLGDFAEADLLIVMGTSLQVHPFASLPDRVRRTCPRLLINLEKVGNFNRSLDISHVVDCDAGVSELARACGWEKDLESTHSEILENLGIDKIDRSTKTIKIDIVNGTDQFKKQSTIPELSKIENDLAEDLANKVKLS